MVIDASILLSIQFAEPTAEWAAAQLDEHPGPLLMSTVTFAEVLILLSSRQPALAPVVRQELLASSIQFIPPDTVQAILAAEARDRYPLNLGDCFVYALAVAHDMPILTLDTDFRSTDRPVIMP